MSASQPIVSLQEITADTVISIMKLSVRESQKIFVAPNAMSLAQALFSPEAWYRAIYSGEELAGFVMLYDESLRPEPPERPQIGVGRFMVDQRHQGKGVGREAMRQVIAHVKAKGIFETLELSYVPAESSPEPFYRSLGCQSTGRVDDGEIVLELRLREA